MPEENGLKHDVYSQTHEDGFDWSKWNSYDKTWEVNLKMDIKEVRLMYSLICFILIIMQGVLEDLQKREITFLF